MKLEIIYQNFVNTYKEGYKRALFYPEFLRLRKRNLTISEIEEKIEYKVPKSTLYFWSYNKIPLAFKDFKGLKRTFSNRDVEDLALIIGHILGDGGISKMKLLHYCNTENFLINEFQTVMKKVFNTEARIRKEPSGIMRLRYGRKFSRALVSIFGKFAGEENKKITPQINKMPLKWKAKLLQALYDDDGSVPKTENYVSLRQKDEDIILWVKETLKEMDINSGLGKDNSGWLLRIAGYKNLLEFRNKVNFSLGYRKQFQLDRIIKKIKFPHWKTKNKIIEFLRLGVKNRKEIAKTLKIQKGVIYGHLHGWKRHDRKSNFGLVDLGIVKVKKIRRINFYYL